MTVSPTNQPLWPLTDRELQYVRRLAHGATNPEMAAELGVTHETVKSALLRIRRKLGVRNRAGVVGEAYRLGLLPLSEETA